MNLRPPARSKSSNIEWLGEIPEHWDTKPLRHLTQFINGFAFKPDEWSDSGIPIIRIENLNGGESFNFSNAVIPERYHVKKGDLLFGWSGNRGTSFGPFLWPSEGLHYLNQHIFRLAGFSCDKSWFYWCLVAVTKVIEEEAHGIIGMVHVTKGRLGAIKIPFIERSEQKTIAYFLDYKTDQIDALIRKKEVLVEKLQEKRSALILRTVTRGLPPDAAKAAGFNPHPKMKNSEIEWLGRIPEHWKVSKLGYIARVVRGASPRPAGDTRFFSGDFAPWITVGEITKDNRMWIVETSTMLTEEGVAHSRTLKENTLVITNSGATLGVPKILGITGSANDGIVAFENLHRSTSKEFLFFYLTTLTSDLRERIKQGSGQPNLNTEIIKGLAVPIPSLHEQETIVNYLERETAKIDQMMEKVKAAIEKLTEYRSALITAAVTGKIDVRKYS